MEFNVRQRKVIEATENNILCLAAASSGKTRVLTERVRRLVEKGCKPEDIICITFTNMAADEMKQRLGDVSEGMFIGTIHSYANLICISNGIDTSDYIADVEFDKLIERAMRIPNQRWPHVKHVLVDEFQDICDNEYEFIRKIPTKNFFVVGDERQSIYGFKGGNDKYIKSMARDPYCAKYYLTQNYRNAPNIMDFANDLIASMTKISPSPECVKEKKGIVEKCNFADAVEELEWSQDWGNWFIITRTNNELAAVLATLEEKEIPCVSFKKNDLDVIQMEALLKDNRVKVLTIHTAKGLENRHVIVVGAKMFNEEERRIAYVAATRAQQSLYWCPTICGRGKKARRADRDRADAGRVFEKAPQKMITF